MANGKKTYMTAKQLVAFWYECHRVKPNEMEKIMKKYNISRWTYKTWLSAIARKLNGKRVKMGAAQTRLNEAVKKIREVEQQTIGLVNTNTREAVDTVSLTDIAVSVNRMVEDIERLMVSATDFAKKGQEFSKQMK